MVLPKKIREDLIFYLTFVAQYVIMLLGYKKRGGGMSPKVGRPTDNPKGRPVHIRLDAKSEEILEKYTKQKNVSRAEAIRRGIAKLEGEIEE